MRLGRIRQPSDTPKPAPVDGEREEARLVTALLAGDVPPAWYRQRVAALARERGRLERDRLKRDDAANLRNDNRAWDA